MLVFLNPLFLWALAAAVIPLTLHLFQRRRTVLTPFPTLRFLKIAQKRSSSRVRFENILLWLLRTLLLAAIACAFAMPVIRKTTAAGWLTRTRRDVAIVIDASYSMAYETERGPAFDVAKEAAVALIEGLGPGDRVCIYLAAETPVAVIEKPTTETASALQAVRALTWEHGSSAIDETLALALFTMNQQREGNRDREIYVLTDGQALPWQGFRTAADGAADASTASAIAREDRDRVPLFALLAGVEKPENTWPATLTLTPSLVLAGQTARITATLGRSGPAREVSITVSTDDEERLTRGVRVEADTETAIELALPGLEPGTWLGRIRTTVDALPCDDEFLFLLRVRTELPVLVAGPDHATRFLRTALAPGGAADAVRVIAPAELDQTDLAAYEAVFLADALPLSGQAILRLEEYVRAGGVLGIFAGDRAAPQAYADLGALLPARVQGTLPIAIADAARAIGRVSREDEIFHQFHLPQGVVPTIALKRVLAFEPLENDAAVVLTAGNEQPFLLARTVGRGKVFQFAVAADRDWSTLPLTAFFVPVVHQIIRHGAGTTQHPPFAPLHTELPAIGYISDLSRDDRLLAPSGREVALRDSGNRTYMIEPLSEPGFYTRVRPGGGEPETVLAANVDRRESRLDVASPEDIAAWTAFKTFHAVRSPEELLAVADDLHNGRALTELLLWLILVLALTEWWFANRTLRKGVKLTDSLTINVAGKVTGAA